MPEGQLSDRAVLVTGGGSGIGRAVCLAAGAEGAAVAVADLDPAAADETVRLVRSLGGACLALAVDVRVPTDCARAVREAAGWTDRLDILINCAGVYPAAALLDATEEHWDQVLDTNLKGTFFMTQAFAAVLVRHGRGGAVVNVSSRTGVRASATHPAYSASKAGVISLTESAAQELGPHRIRVNAVAPGPILPGDAPGAGMPPAATRARQERMPLGRFGRPEEVAAAIVFLAGDRASFATGATLVVDGGGLLP